MKDRPDSSDLLEDCGLLAGGGAGLLSGLTASMSSSIFDDQRKDRQGGHATLLKGNHPGGLQIVIITSFGLTRPPSPRQFAVKTAIKRGGNPSEDHNDFLWGYPISVYNISICYLHPPMLRCDMEND